MVCPGLKRDALNEILLVFGAGLNRGALLLLLLLLAAAAGRKEGTSESATEDAHSELYHHLVSIVYLHSVVLLMT